MPKLLCYLAVAISTVLAAFASDLPEPDLLSFLQIDALATNTQMSGVVAPAPSRADSISPDDVVPASVMLWGFGTNGFAVRWKYTETGARRALAAWEADANHPVMSSEWKEAWFQHRTDKQWFTNKTAAKNLMVRLKGE